MTLAYITFIDENLQYAESLKEELVHWEKIYNRRIFDKGWAISIQEIINLISQEIENNLKECQYYLKRIKEIKENNGKNTLSQFIHNQDNAPGKSDNSEDTHKDPPISKSEDMGSTPKETNDIGWEDE